MMLPLHPVIESLRLKLYTGFFKPEDTKLWVEIAVSRYLRELSITCFNALLPSSLYTCKSLVTLKLNDRILVDVPRVVCLPSLKTLHLDRVKYADGESLERLLSNCSVLEDLLVDLFVGENVRKFTVCIPSLLSFEITCSYTCGEYVIDTPSLKYFKNSSKSSSFSIANMPKLVKADLALFGSLDYIKKLLTPATSVKRLSVSVIGDYAAEAVYGDDINFDYLEHLKFSIRNTKYWSKSSPFSFNLLWFLKSCPKLRDLDFHGKFVPYDIDTSVCWEQLSYVPQCLLSSLQTFKWTCYNPTTEERDLATYILRSSCRLKTATFFIWSKEDQQKKAEMKEEILSTSRGSSTCDLVFIDY